VQVDIVNGVMQLQQSLYSRKRVTRYPSIGNASLAVTAHKRYTHRS